MSQETSTPDSQAPEVVKQKRDKAPRGILWVICVLSALTFLNSVILVVLLGVAVMNYEKGMYIPYSDPYFYEEPSYDDYGSAEPGTAEPAPLSSEAPAVESSSAPATTTTAAL